MIPRVMAEHSIPQYVDALKLVASEQSFDASMSTLNWDRLKEAVHECQDSAKVTLSFSRDEDNFAVVSGSLSLIVNMTCQRCLDSVAIPLQSNFELALVFNDEQAKVLPKRLEPIEMDDQGQLDVLSLIEDEALLSLPDFPKHEEGECEIKMPSEEFDQNVSDTKENPFDVLATLKKR